MRGEELGGEDLGGVEPDGGRAVRAEREGGVRTRLLGPVVAVVVAGLLLLATATSDVADRAGALDYALLLLGALSLAGYATAPRVVLIGATLAISGYVLRVHPGTLAALPVVGAMHTASRAGHRGIAAGAGVCFLAVYFATGPGSPDVRERTALLAGWLLCAVATGLADKNWQAYLRQTEERALEAERTREEAALRRAGEERLRIARELHDSLTHSISIVKLQAGVAVHLARKRGEQVPEALLAIQEASGEAMSELRATLDVLRADATEERGVEHVKGLVERASSAGIETALTVAGDPRPLPDELDRAAYRIVQEALTNAARHAGPARVAVRIGYGPRSLTVSIEDDGRGAGPEHSPGVGLTGMRERVGALGGTLRTGPRAEGGFGVRAELPLEEL